MYAHIPHPTHSLHPPSFLPRYCSFSNEIVQAGTEASWLKDNMPYFKSQAYEHDDLEFRKMIEEVETRPDLKAMMKA
jgi:hypothetical protein